VTGSCAAGVAAQALRPAQAMQAAAMALLRSWWNRGVVDARMAG